LADRIDLFDKFCQSENYLQTKVSVIIPAFNAEKYLQNAVESVLNTGCPSLEVIVVEDGSTDATLDVAQELSRRYPAAVMLYRHADGENRGAGAARNLGIRMAHGDIVAFLDADDWYLPNRFDVAVPTLETCADADGVYELTSVQYEGEIGDSGFRKQYGNVIGISEPQSECLTRLLSMGYCWSTNALSVRKSIFERTGLFDESLERGQDVEMWIRMSCVARLVPGNRTSPVACYRRHSGNRSMPGRVEEMIEIASKSFGWAKKNCTGGRASQDILDGLLTFTYGNMDEFFQQGNTSRALSLLRGLRRGFPHLLMSRRYWANYVKVSRRRYGI